MRAESPRLRRLIVLLAALLLSGITARLGYWQYDKARSKLALQAARDAADRQAPLLALPTEEVHAHRRVRLQGRWRPEFNLWLGNRPMGQQVGFLLLTPLQLDDGSLVWVQRGWQARTQAGYAAPPWPASPAGAVTVEGRLLRQASRAYDLGGAASGPVRQNLELSEMPAPGLRVQPWVIWQLDGCAPLRCDWPAPDLGVSKHHGYVVQWFALSALTLGLYVWFQLIAPLRRRAA